MITINNHKFARNEKEFLESLFTGGETCYGYYRTVKHGVKLMNMQNELFAFIKVNGNSAFAVSASISNGKARYMFSTMSVDDKTLGLDLIPYSKQSDYLMTAIKNQCAPLPGREKE